MKRKNGTILIFLVLFTWSTGGTAAQEEGVGNHYFTLKNGMQAIVESRPQTPLVHLVFSVGLGSRDEKAEENGFVHLIEHVMLLGGTKQMAADEFSGRLRAGGVYFNAHTDHDLLTLEFTLIPARLEEVLDLAREKLFATEFTPEIVEREKKAIFEEIRQINDDPMARGQQMVIAGIFADHPYARPVYGDPGVIAGAVPEALEKMYRRYFTAGNMALAVVGGIEADAVKDLIEKTFSGFPAGERVDRSLPPPPEIPKTRQMNLEMDVNESHLFLGFPAPARNDESRLAFDMVVQIFGRGYNPLLRAVLRSTGRDLVESVDPSFIPLDHAGLYLIHIRCRDGMISVIKREILQFFTRAARMPFSLDDMLPSQRSAAVDHLDNALTHLTMSYHSFQENGLSLAAAYARSMLLQPEKNQENYLVRLSRLKSRQINRAIDKILAGSRYVQVVIGPKEKP